MSLAPALKTLPGLCQRIALAANKEILLHFGCGFFGCELSLFESEFNGALTGMSLLKDYLDLQNGFSACDDW